MKRAIVFFVVMSCGMTLHGISDAEKEALKPILKYIFTTSEESFNADKLRLPADVNQAIINEAIPFNEVFGIEKAMKTPFSALDAIFDRKKFFMLPSLVTAYSGVLNLDEPIKSRKDGLTLLMWALGTESPSKDLPRLFLEHGASTAARTKFTTPLHMAVGKNNLDEVLLLKKHSKNFSADVQAKNKIDKTPLDVALDQQNAGADNQKIIDVLLDAQSVAPKVDDETLKNSLINLEQAFKNLIPHLQ